jgi:DNA-binding transcriptional ArsR family regulator
MGNVGRPSSSPTASERADRSDGQATSEQELVEVFDMGIRLVEYHLKVLEDADLIANVADGKSAGSEVPRYVTAATL